MKRIILLLMIVSYLLLAGRFATATSRNYPGDHRHNNGYRGHTLKSHIYGNGKDYFVNDFQQVRSPAIFKFRFNLGQRRHGHLFRDRHNRHLFRDRHNRHLFRDRHHGDHFRDGLHGDHFRHRPKGHNRLRHHGLRSFRRSHRR